MNIAVIGLGKLGAPLAATLAFVGHRVVGVDLNADTVDTVNRAESPVDETGLAEMIRHLPPGAFRATTDTRAAVDQTDLAFVVVPTPSDQSGRFSNDYVSAAVANIGDALRGTDRPYIVVVSSTVMPRSTGTVLRTALESAARRPLGPDLALFYSPEFIALGSVLNDLRNPDFVMIGYTEPLAQQGEVIEEVLRTVVEKTKRVHHLATVDVEVAKLAVNVYVTMKISFANQLAELCEHAGAHASIVARAVGDDSRIGPKYLKPGAAFGGPCFPRDAVAFQRFAADLGIHAPLAGATTQINDYQPFRIARLLLDHHRVGVLGAAFKADTAVTEHSFGLAVAQLLRDDHEVSVHDPVAPIPEEFHAVDDAHALVAASDAVLVATPWPFYASLDFSNTALVVDMWDLIPAAPNVWKVGG